jgi:hypothetical protein
LGNKNEYGDLIGKLNGRNHLEDLGVDGRVNEKQLLRELVWTIFNLLNIERSGGL